MKKLTIYGASDDLIELDGAIRDELGASFKYPTYLLFSNGLQVRIEYDGDGRPGEWCVEIVREGTSGAHERTQARSGPHSHSDAPDYSDVLTIEVPDGTRLLSHQHGEQFMDAQIPMLTMIRDLRDRCMAFDQWFGDLDRRDEVAFCDAIDAVLAKGGVK